jgi:quinol monooxygenase YgiN
MTNPLTIVAIAAAVPGKEAALREAQAKLVAATLAEPGCIRYQLHQSLDDPRILVFTELWATERDWRAHMQGDAIRQFHASGASRLIRDFTLLRLAPVAGGDSSSKCRRPD